MPDVSDHRPMTPSWIDLGTEVEAATHFYTGLFGWETQAAGPVEETGGYGFFTLDGKMVAGYGPQQNPGPPNWTTYVAVPDAAAIAAKVTEAGGTVVVPPMDVMGQGTMAVFQDAAGAFFSVWQAGAHRGAQVVREPGSFTWAELDTRDLDGSRAFYRAVFGWDARVSEGDMPYTEFLVDGESVAGMMAMPPMVPAEVPNYWLVYFSVADADAAVARVQELGGSVLAPVMGFPGGRFAVVTDPQGAAFGIMEAAETV